MFFRNHMIRLMTIVHILLVYETIFTIIPGNAFEPNNGDAQKWVVSWVYLYDACYLSYRCASSFTSSMSCSITR
jgi:hypothetical protein